MDENCSAIRLRAARTSLSDSVYETLLEAILEGRLAAGVEVNAVILASQLEVSRTPVQEAIRRLEADGLVINPLGKKARVAKFQRQDIVEVYEMRTLLESKAAALAARRITAEDLTSLRREIDALVRGKKAVDWITRVLNFDVHFHDVIAETSGNTRLRDDIRRYRLLVRGLCRMAGSLENLEAATAEHLSILEGLEARNSKAASAAMSEHIKSRLNIVLRECLQPKPKETAS